MLFVNQTKAVLLLKRHIAADESPMVEVPVDKALQEIQIDIQGDTAMPYPVIRKPNSKFKYINFMPYPVIRKHKSKFLVN